MEKNTSKIKKTKDGYSITCDDCGECEKNRNLSTMEEAVTWFFTGSDAYTNKNNKTICYECK